MGYHEETSRALQLLSASRLGMESAARLCARDGCAYLCTGLNDSYCCRACAKNGTHGPRCERRLLRCLNCSFAVTGVAGCPGHCCRLCARGEGHGPRCQRVLVPPIQDEEGEVGEEMGEASRPEVPRRRRGVECHPAAAGTGDALLFGGRAVGAAASRAEEVPVEGGDDDREEDSGAERQEDEGLAVEEAANGSERYEQRGEAADADADAGEEEEEEEEKEEELDDHERAIADELDERYRAMLRVEREQQARIEALAQRLQALEAGA